jgi:hypothetical protein
MQLQHFTANEELPAVHSPAVLACHSVSLLSRIIAQNRFPRIDHNRGMRLKTVFLFPNGMVAVCGYDGQQIPELQGRFSEVKEKIAALADEQTEWYGDFAG